MRRKEFTLPYHHHLRHSTTTNSAAASSMRTWVGDMCDVCGTARSSFLGFVPVMVWLRGATLFTITFEALGGRTRKQHKYALSFSFLLNILNLLCKIGTHVFPWTRRYPDSDWQMTLQIPRLLPQIRETFAPISPIVIIHMDKYMKFDIVTNPLLHSTLPPASLVSTASLSDQRERGHNDCSLLTPFTYFSGLGTTVASVA